ncbi:hypothetical protein FKM82_000789 [Ascaphus truei]
MTKLLLLDNNTASCAASQKQTLKPNIYSKLTHIVTWVHIHYDCCHKNTLSDNDTHVTFSYITLMPLLQTLHMYSHTRSC